jgi:hypothetical protein
MNNFEYVIWGIAPKKTEEEILLSKAHGKTITDKVLAYQMAKLLLDRHDCQSVRVQEINLNDGFNSSFINSI